MSTLTREGSAAPFAALRRWLPEGRELPDDEWRARHQAILITIFAHAVGVAAFGIVMDVAPLLVLVESGLIAALGALASAGRITRRFRSAVAGLALVTSSAAIVQFSGGYIEAHFHFFIVLAIISLYQDWVPFLLAIVYVALDHGVVGAIVPEVVYNHPDAFAHPWRWAIIHAIAVLGESVALLATWKVAESARRRTSLVLDSAAEGILGLDLDGRITFANPAAATMAQRSVEELRGMDIDALLHRAGGAPALDDAWVPDAARRMDDPGMEFERKDGTRIPVECDRTPIRHNDVLVGAVLTVKDVTERRASEASLRRAVSALTATLESTTDGILVIDQQGRISGFNRRFLEMWGIPVSVASAGDDSRALAFVKDQLADPDAFLKKVKELYENPEAESFDVLRFRDGRVFERYSQPQRSAEGVMGRVWSFRDVTERLKAEEARREQRELQAANDRLRELDRLKTQFINNAAHELGTPLTPIKLQAHLLRTEMMGPLSEKQRSSVNVLARNVDQLQLLLKDVVDSARVQAGKLEIRTEPIPLDRIARETYESFHQAADQQGVALSLDAQPDVIVQADARRMTQVLFNLVRNALRFTPGGGRISLHVRKEGARAVVEVRDTGRGVKPEDIGRLFRPFTQLHEMEASSNGAGLGLYISKGIVDSHGGSISCASPGEGRGATFRVELPLADS